MARFFYALALLCVSAFVAAAPLNQAARALDSTSSELSNWDVELPVSDDGTFISPSADF